MRFPGICAIRSATGLWPFLILMIGAGLTLFHKGPHMEQLARLSSLSGAENLERETGVNQPKWNSRRAATAAAGDTRGRAAEAAAAARQECRPPAARIPDRG